MKKIILSIFTSVVLFSCQSSIDGEGPGSVKKVIPVENIKSLEVSCNCNVTLIPGNENKVEVESHQNIIDNLEVNAKGNILIIEEKSAVDKYNNYNVFVYTTRDLKDLEVNKLTNLKISGTLNTDELSLDIKDQAKISEAYIITNDFELKAQNQSQVTLQGTASSMELKAYDQANLDLSKFEVNDAKILTEDNVQLNINSRNSLVGEAKGTSVVNYLGDPRKDTKIADQAQVVKKD